MKNHLGKERLYDFLAGLNKELDEVRGQILGRRPLPPMGEAFAEVRHEESRCQVMLGEKKDASVAPLGDRPVENAALMTKSSGDRPSGDQKTNQHHGARIAINSVIPENDVGTFMGELLMPNLGDSLKAKDFRLLQQTKQRTLATMRQLGFP